MGRTSQKELVSVVIPAYNAERFIEDSVGSCFNQTHRPIEVVVVNDGSTDATPDVVNDLCDSVPDNEVELRMIDIGENKGAANALNVGFSNAQGDHICWLSADDMFLDEGKVERQVDFMSRTGALWSYFKDSYAGETVSTATLTRSSFLPYARIMDPLFIHDHELRLMMLLFRNPINGSSVMIRKDCIEQYGQFDPIMNNADADGDLWLRYSALRLGVGAIDGAPIFYRFHPTQLSTRKLDMMYGCETSRMRVLLTLRERDLSENIKKFSLFLPVCIKLKGHLARPFVSEFLCNHVLSHRRDFSGLFVKYIKRISREVEMYISQSDLRRDRFQEYLQKSLTAPVFCSFREMFNSVLNRKNGR